MIDSRVEWEKYLMRIERTFVLPESKCLKPMTGGCIKEIKANQKEFPITKSRAM